MNILVLNGSPRENGNTEALVNAFSEGARGKGHEVTIIPVGRKKINGCIGCEYCHTEGKGQCVQKDDMQEVYQAMQSAELVVFASPVYYWTFTGQMQSTISRFFALGKPKVKKYAMILSSGSEGVYDAIVSQYQNMLRFFDAENLGIRTAAGARNKSEEALEELKAFGESL